MASVFKIPRSRFWFAAFRGENGQRVQKSTKQTKRSEAMETALSWDRLAAKGRNKTITEAQARKVVAEILERSIGETLDFFTTRGWITEWLSSKKGTVDEGSHARYRQVLDDFLEHLGDRAELTLAAINPKDIRRFRDSLLKGRSVATVNQTVQKFLSPPFLAAVRLGYIPMNPCAAVQPLLDECEAQRDVFSGEQVSALLRATDELFKAAKSGNERAAGIRFTEEESKEWKGVILTGYFTGLRLRDVTHLVWQQIDLKTNAMLVRARKNKAMIAMPIHPQLAVWFRERPAAIGKAPVFPSLTEKGTGGKTGLSGRFATIMAKAKVVGRVLRGADGNGRKTTSLSFHSLRHSFVSALANAGVPPEVRKLLSGHADDRSHAGYTHHAIESLRGALEKVPLLAS